MAKKTKQLPACMTTEDAQFVIGSREWAVTYIEFRPLGGSDEKLRCSCTQGDSAFAEAKREEEGGREARIFHRPAINEAWAEVSHSFAMIN